MKIVAINGSPRKNGNTALLLDAVRQEVEAAGVEFQVFQPGPNVHPCMACYNCLDTGSLRCVRKDDGVNDIIADPGFGFGKTLEHNYDMLQHLECFHELGMPLLVGVSRKSMIYRMLGGTPAEALNGTTAIHVISLLKGAHILRVHDVREAVEAVRIVDACQHPESLRV